MMILKAKYTKDKSNDTLEWKEKNKKYLNQLQKFLDATDSIQTEYLKNNIITQMLKCDQILTEIAQKEIQKYKNQMYNIE